MPFKDLPKKKNRCKYKEYAIIALSKFAENKTFFSRLFAERLRLAKGGYSKVQNSPINSPWLHENKRLDCQKINFNKKIFHLTLKQIRKETHVERTIELFHFSVRFRYLQKGGCYVPMSPIWCVTPN